MSCILTPDGFIYLFIYYFDFFYSMLTSISATSVDFKASTPTYSSLLLHLFFIFFQWE